MWGVIGAISAVGANQMGEPQSWSRWYSLSLVGSENSWPGSISQAKTPPQGGGWENVILEEGWLVSCRVRGTPSLGSPRDRAGMGA